MRTMRWQQVRRRRRRTIWLLVIVALLLWWLWPNGDKKNKEIAADTVASQVENGSFTIFIHPGNGGTEDGPIYPEDSDNPEIRAKDINLAISEAAVRALSKEGIRAVLSRETDTFVDAIDRKERAENEGASLSLAIYVNANYRDPAYAGFQIVDYKKVDWEANYKQRMTWVKNLEGAMVDRLANYGTESHGIFTRNSAFVADIPTAVILVGMLSNDIERERLVDEKYQWEIANAITDSAIYYRDNLLNNTDTTSDLPAEENIADIRVPF